MFSKKKKKIEISAPSNFQHRVHTGFDSHSNKFVGLPKQWASLVDDKPASGSPYRPSPMVDPLSYTMEAGNHHQIQNGGSSVVRSNSLRSNSPPQFRGRGRGSALQPPPGHLPPVPESEGRFPGHPGFNPAFQPGVQPGMMSNRSSVSDQYPPPLQRPSPAGSNGGFQQQHHQQQQPQQGPPLPPQAYRVPHPAPSQNSMVNISLKMKLLYFRLLDY